MIVPRFSIHDVLPQWIVSSAKAAYHPVTKTIYIRADRIFTFDLLHELGHHVIELFGGGRVVHKLYDRMVAKWTRLS